MSNIKSYIPLIFKDNKVIEEITNAEDIEFDKLQFNIEDIRKQLFIDTATWALDIYERELGIKTNTSKSLEDRRSLVSSKWRGTGKVDNELIKRVADAFTNGDVEIGFDGNILIKFNSVLGIPPNMEDVYDSLGEIIPAHLDILYEYIYRTHGMLEEYTHEFLSQFTHEELREGVI